MATRMAAQEPTRQAQATASANNIIRVLETRAASTDDELGTGIRATATASARELATYAARVDREGLPNPQSVFGDPRERATAIAAQTWRPFAGTADRLPPGDCLRLFDPGTPVILIADCWQGTLNDEAFLLGIQHAGYRVLQHGGREKLRVRGGGFESGRGVTAFSGEHVCLKTPRDWTVLHLPTGQESYFKTDVRPVCGDQAQMFEPLSFWPPYVTGLGHDRYPRLVG